MREFLAPAVKALSAERPGARARPAGRRRADIAADATRQALDGIVRSLAKELRRGATANLLWVADEASLASALRFFLSGKSAYVDGQPLLLGAGTAPAPKDWDLPLAGKTALVTGAARGIGAAIAGVLARDGAHVIVADLQQAGEALAKVANRVGGTTLHLDVASPEAPKRLLDHLAAHTDGLDVLVHNAGITRDKLMANMKPEQWDSVIAVNLQSQLAINAALLDSDQLNEQSRVVCLSSTTGLSGNRGQTNYGATKAGVIGLVRSSAAAFAAHGDSTINADRARLHRHRDDREDAAGHPRGRPPAVVAAAGRPAGRRRRGGGVAVLARAPAASTARSCACAARTWSAPDVPALSSPPSLLPLYGRAALTGPLHRGDSLPDSVYTLADQTHRPRAPASSTSGCAGSGSPTSCRRPTCTCWRSRCRWR